MSLFVDCAVVDEVAALAATYPLAGVTTNPTLRLAAVERGQRLNELDLARELLHACDGVIFIQPVAPDSHALASVSLRLAELDSARIVIKLPASTKGLGAAARLAPAAVRFAFTAVYSLAQAYIAAMSGAEWLIPYFDRLRRSGADATMVVGQMHSTLAGPAMPANTRLLAASLKSPAQVGEALLAGADDVTVPPEVLRAMVEDPSSEAALARFEHDAQRISALLNG
jgi:TalC/MipB family fructose-6-phosphate aldolase